MRECVPDTPPIFVIHLRRSAERREHITAQLAAQNLAFEIHPAVDANDLSERSVRDLLGPSALEPQPHLGRRLTMGEIACGLSHCELYRRMQNENIEHAIVLEDDVDLLPSFAPVVRFLGPAAGVSSMARSRWSLGTAKSDRLLGDPRRFEMVLLGHHSARHGYDAGAETCWYGRPLHGGCRVARACEFAMGAYAYYLTRAAAAKLARHAQPMRMPADWVTGYAPSAGVRLHAVTPPCVVPHPRFLAATTITGRDTTDANVEARPRRSDQIERLRRWGGAAFLRVRKMGVFPAAYSKRC